MSDVYIGLPGINSELEMMVTPIVEQTFATTSDQLSHYDEWIIELPNITTDDPLQAERSYFESIRSDLMNDPTMKDGFVAILNNKVIGHGSNGAELAINMYKVHGYIPILVEKVSEDITYTTSPLTDEF